MKTRFHILLALMLSSLVQITSHAQVEVKEIATRPGVTVRFVYARAENPVASAVLFQGGAGNIGIFPNGSMRIESFLSGGAHRFNQNGISVVIPDVPSDRSTLDDFRDTPEHAQDNAVLMEFLRRQSKVPVWASALATVRCRRLRPQHTSRTRGRTALFLPPQLPRKGFLEEWHIPSRVRCCMK